MVGVHGNNLRKKLVTIVRDVQHQVFFHWAYSFLNFSFLGLSPISGQPIANLAGFL